jgi:peptidoglycan/LPS O-acetylase OafA/YrhL
MHKAQNIFLLLILYLTLLGAGVAVIHYTSSDLPSAQFITLLTLMTAITMGAYLLVMANNRRSEKDRGIYLLAAIGGKFLAYLALLLIWWAMGKNLTKDFIIAFFVLYLVLTLFLLGVLFKMLKSN